MNLASLLWRIREWNPADKVENTKKNFTKGFPKKEAFFIG